MSEIRKLDRDYLLRVLECDPETGVLRWKRRDDSPRWSGRYAGTVAGYVAPSGYVRVQYQGRPVQAHRVVWTLVNGDIPDGLHIDHINGDPSDNRIANLRLATRSQNLANCRWGRKPNRLPQGVFKTNPKSRYRLPYRAQMSVNGKRVWLGTFATVEEAATAYRNAGKRLHGEYMRHNHDSHK